jgi:hypothetical protein
MIGTDSRLTLHAKPASLTVDELMIVSNNPARAFSGKVSLTSACPSASRGLCWMDCDTAVSKCLQQLEHVGDDLGAYCEVFGRFAVLGKFLHMISRDAPACTDTTCRSKQRLTRDPAGPPRRLGPRVSARVGPRPRLPLGRFDASLPAPGASAASSPAKTSDQKLSACFRPISKVAP